MASEGSRAMMKWLRAKLIAEFFESLDNETDFASVEGRIDQLRAIRARLLEQLARVNEELV